MNNYFIGVSWAVASIIGMGSGDFVSGLVVRKVNTKLALVYIYFFQTIISGLLALFINKIGWDARNIIIAIMAGVLQMFGLKFFYRAMSEGKISIVSPIFSLSSLATIFWGILVLKEALSGEKLLALVILFLGAILMSTSVKDIKQISYKDRSVKDALIGAVIFGFALLLFTISVNNENFYGYNTIFAGSTLLTSLLFLGKTNFREAKKSIRQVWLMVLLVGIFYSLGNIFYGTFLGFIPSAVTASIYNAFPMVTILASLILLKEKLNLNQIIGILMLNSHSKRNTIN